MRDPRNEALTLIASEGCTNGNMLDCRDDPRYDPYSKWLRAWCPACIAEAALEGKFPRQLQCIELKAAG